MMVHDLTTTALACWYWMPCRQHRQYFASSVAMSPLGLLMVAIDDDSKASAKSLNFFIAGGAYLPVLLAL